jgi:peptidyl-prolyl cis-trans isomerase B (cyclophilin B)
MNVIMACIFLFASCAKGDDVAKKTSSKGSAPKIVNSKVYFETTQGNFTVELFADVPTTTQNFKDLVSSGFYNGLTFHRYVPGFVIQGGDPTGTGGGGSGKTIPLEITAHHHDAGALGMARSADPNSASSQFYICLDAAHNLDGGYTVFGRVTKGMDNVLKLRQGDKMVQVTLVKPKTVK